MARQLNSPGWPPTSRSVVARTGSVATSTLARSPCADASEAPAVAAAATATTNGDRSAASPAALVMRFGGMPTGHGTP